TGVLPVPAPRSQPWAGRGAEGSPDRCGAGFWEQLVGAMQQHFRAENFTDAVVHAIDRTGELLSAEFPRQPDDRNELPNAVEEG
ncbi:MAG: hypothetical protein ACREP1_07585, partial [Rhodanobacteraceae bacterium]